MLRLAALRWLGVCVILLTPLSAANLASAHELVQTKTRVGGFESAAPLHIWLNGSATERSYSGNLRCEPEVASESLLAARGAKPPNMSPAGASRRGAFREAKRQSGVPVSQQPNRVTPNVDKRGNAQPGRTYEFDQGPGRDRTRIRDDAAGHDFGPNEPQNRGPHFNDGAGNHYDY